MRYKLQFVLFITLACGRKVLPISVLLLGGTYMIGAEDLDIWVWEWFCVFKSILRESIT